MAAKSNDVDIHDIDQRLDHPVVARLTLSGTQLYLGTNAGPRETSLYVFIPDEQAEPTYFSVAEARMLIASLQAAVANAEGGE